MLTKKLQQDIIEAMKQKNQDKIDCLRFLTAQIKNKEIELKKDLDDDQIVAVISKQIKELKEAAELFKKGNRDDLVKQNQQQIEIISSYLAAEITDEALKKEVKKIIADNQKLYDKTPKAIIGIAIKTLKDKASSQRIVKLLNL